MFIPCSHCTRMTLLRRDGASGGLEGGRIHQNSLRPPSALEFLKNAMQCWHFRNLLPMFLESVAAF